MLGRRRGGREPRIQEVSARLAVGLGNWLLSVPATAFLGYSAFYVSDQIEPDVETVLALVAAAWGWVVCVAIDMRRWWADWNKEPDCVVDLETGETEFRWTAVSDPFRDTEQPGPRSVETCRIGPVVASGHARSPAFSGGAPRPRVEPIGDGSGVWEPRSSGSFEASISSPALGSFRVGGNWGLWPVLIRRLETLGAPASAKGRWWNKDKPLPAFEWSEDELEAALATRSVPYRDPVLRIAMHRAHKRGRTRLGRTDLDEAVRRLCGEPVTPVDYLAQGTARLVGILVHPLVKWPLVAVMVLVAIATVWAALVERTGHMTLPF